MSQTDALPCGGQTLGVPGGLSVLVTRGPDEHDVLRCDDDVLTPQRPPACSAALAQSGAIRPGMAFNDPVSGLEVVCTRAGHGTLTFAGRPLQRGSAFGHCPRLAGRKLRRDRSLVQPHTIITNDLAELRDQLEQAAPGPA